VAGLGTAALFLIATILTSQKTLVLVFLSLLYCGLTFQQPNIGAVCLDIGRKHAGAVFAFSNTAGNAARRCSIGRVRIVGGAIWKLRRTADSHGTCARRRNTPVADGRSHP
jgi:hypothetical protein